MFHNSVGCKARFGARLVHFLSHFPACITFLFLPRTNTCSETLTEIVWHVQYTLGRPSRTRKKQGRQDQNPPCCLRRVKSSDPRGIAMYSSCSSSCAALPPNAGEKSRDDDDDVDGGDTTDAADENHEVDLATVRACIDGDDDAPAAEDGRPEPASADRDDDDDETLPAPPSPAAPLCSTV